MRSLALLLLVALSVSASESAIRWGGSVEQGFLRSRESGKPVLALFWAEW